MTRIIAGSVGGRRISVPRRGTRPTSDRVREAIFSRLDHDDRIVGAAVLDLYAGSGALGLEALSRGAARAVFVEQSAEAARVIADNLASLGVSVGAIRREPAASYLAYADETFDLVFLDPPYDVRPSVLAGVLAALVPSLAPGGAVVLEASTRSAEPIWPDGLVPVASKRYGETVVHYAESGDPRPSRDTVEP